MARRLWENLYGRKTKHDAQQEKLEATATTDLRQSDLLLVLANKQRNPWSLFERMTPFHETSFQIRSIPPCKLDTKAFSPSWFNPSWL